MVNKCINSEVPSFIHSKDGKGGGRKIYQNGSLGAVKVTQRVKVMVTISREHTISY